MLNLGRELSARSGRNPEVAVLAPRAADCEWYPERFVAPLEQNESHLSSALQLTDRILSEVGSDHGYGVGNIVLGGFSQGACLAVEFAARSPRSYAAVLAFSGGLIGPPGTRFEHTGQLKHVPVLLGCSRHDPYIPYERVLETESKLRRMGAAVTSHVYPGGSHAITAEELEIAERLVFG